VLPLPFEHFYELFTFVFSGCDAMQTFRDEPIYTEVNPGANAELRCVIDNIGGECRWQKDGKVNKILYCGRLQQKSWILNKKLKSKVDTKIQRGAN
jgi:hypothetical protein